MAYEIQTMGETDCLQVLTKMAKGCVAEHNAILGDGWSRPERMSFLIAHSATAHTLWRDEHPLACGGIMISHAGVASTFLFHVEPGVAGRGMVKMVQASRKVIKALLKKGVAHRIECLSMLPYEECSQRFLERMGLRFESTRPYYGINRENFYMFSRLAEA